jgi:hypothetical protein
MQPAKLLLLFGTAVFLLTISCGDGAKPTDLLTVTDKTPVIDGSVAAGEYSFTQDFTNSSLYAARSKDTVSLAFKAGVTGWVAIGTGSTVMNNADIIIGYVKDGQPQIKQQLGAGHGHQDTNKADSGILGMAIKEENNATTLEVSLRASSLIKAGQKELPLILAYSTQDSFMVRHSFRTAVVLQLQ